MKIDFLLLIWSENQRLTKERLEKSVAATTTTQRRGKLEGGIWNFCVFIFSPLFFSIHQQIRNYHISSVWKGIVEIFTVNSYTANTHCCCCCCSKSLACVSRAYPNSFGWLMKMDALFRDCSPTDDMWVYWLRCLSFSHIKWHGCCRFEIRTHTIAQYTPSHNHHIDILNNIRHLVAILHTVSFSFHPRCRSCSRSCVRFVHFAKSRVVQHYMDVCFVDVKRNGTLLFAPSTRLNSTDTFFSSTQTNKINGSSHSREENLPTWKLFYRRRVSNIVRAKQRERKRKISGFFFASNLKPVQIMLLLLL